MSDQTPFLDHVLLGNPLRAWFTALAILGGVLILLRVLRGAVVRKMAAFASRTATDWDDLLVELLTQTRLFLVFVVSMYPASFALHLPATPVHLLRTAAILAFLVQVALWGNHLVTHWIARYLRRRGQEDASTRTTVATLGLVVRIVLWSILLLLALDNLGIRVTGLITGLGIGGVAVALAAQEVLRDLFASLAIALDKPFLIGETINVDLFTGTVEHIGIKTTRLRSIDGEELIVSNSDILNSRIRNYKRMEERRVLMNIGVIYQTPADKVAAIPSMIKEVVEAQANVRFGRSHFTGFGDSALLFETAYYITTPDYDTMMDVQHAAGLAVMRRFEKEGIKFAYPTRTLFLRQEAAPRA